MELWQVVALLYRVVGVVLSYRWSVKSYLLLAGGRSDVRLGRCALGHVVLTKSPFREYGVGVNLYLVDKISIATPSQSV